MTTWNLERYQRMRDAANQRATTCATLAAAAHAYPDDAEGYLLLATQYGRAAVMLGWLSTGYLVYAKSGSRQVPVSGLY